MTLFASEIVAFSHFIFVSHIILSFLMYIFAYTFCWKITNNHIRATFCMQLRDYFHSNVAVCCDVAKIRATKEKPCSKV